MPASPSIAFLNTPLSSIFLPACLLLRTSHCLFNGVNLSVVNYQFSFLLFWVTENGDFIEVSSLPTAEEVPQKSLYKSYDTHRPQKFK